MPKRSKEELKLSKRVLPFLLEREQSKKTYEIVQRLLNSMMKAKSSHRRKEYRERLNVILQNLSVRSEDLENQKEKNKELQKKYEYVQEKHSKYINDNI